MKLCPNSQCVVNSDKQGKKINSFSCVIVTMNKYKMCNFVSITMAMNPGKELLYVHNNDKKIQLCLQHLKNGRSLERTTLWLLRIMANSVKLKFQFYWLSPSLFSFILYPQEQFYKIINQEHTV